MIIDYGDVFKLVRIDIKVKEIEEKLGKELNSELDNRLFEYWEESEFENEFIKFYKLVENSEESYYVVLVDIEKCSEFENREELKEYILGDLLGYISK